MNYFLPLLFFSSQVYSQITDNTCVCVQPHECSESGTVITDGHNIIDFRSSSNSICTDNLICCVLPNDTSIEEEQDFENSVPNPEEGDFAESNNGQFETNDFSMTVTQSGPQENQPEPQENQDKQQETQEELKCGEAAYQPDLIIYKVSGGLDETATDLGDFPWMLLMTYEDNGVKENIGGASLIHPQVALTAAHNVQGKDFDKIIIRGAEFNLDTEEESTTQDQTVKKIIFHPEFSKLPPKYDVAIIILEKPFTLTLTVRTLCLPPKGLEPAWDSCLATGWGSRGQDPDFGPRILRKAAMQIIPKDTCNAIFRKKGFRPNYKIHDSFICAGSNTTADTCQGDGGGPLMCKPNNSQYYYLVGITSWGLECGQKGIVPGAYTDVSLVLDFIENSLMNEKNINLNI